MASEAAKRAAKALVRRFEGGLADIKGDTGGLTNFGISFTFIKDRHIDVNGDGVVSEADIRGMSVEQADQLYETHFWQPLGCDALPDALALAVYDSGVNQGKGWALKALAQCKGDDATRLREFLALRMLRYTECKLWPSCKRGWTRRLMACAVLAGRFM